MRDPQKRALIVFGAGASVEYGIPVTSEFTQIITDKINLEPKYKEQGIADVYNYVKDTLVDFYKEEHQAHFERIYHVLHELYAHYHQEGAAAKFSPVMAPFLAKTRDLDKIKILAAAKAIIEIIYHEVSAVCERNTCSLEPLKQFFAQVEDRYIPRIYTTNYDNFVGQATEGKYFTGFNRKLNDLNLFNAESFFQQWNTPCLYHLHGSIHFGFPAPYTKAIRMGELAWFEDTAEALRHAFITASGVPKMDGTVIERTSIITGLEKLGRLQQNPYAFYYSEFSRDAMAADVIFVMGSGLADLHLNKWIKEVRIAKPKTPIVFVGFWKDLEDDFSSPSELEISLLHDLRIEHFERTSDKIEWNEWTLFKKNNAAIWKKGFHAFLNQSVSLSELLDQIDGSV